MTSYLNRALMIGLLCSAPGAAATTIFINEFHYDNNGADVNEGIEIAAAAGTNLSGLHLVLYNGSNGTSYADTALKGIVPDQYGGYGTLYFALPGIQNGPDGIVLATIDGEVLQFLSYEGVFIANEGVAAGMTSVDIGIFETPDSDLLSSLQLVGNGVVFDDFTWIQTDASPGFLNAGQVFTAPVPLPGTVVLMISALGALFGCRRSSQAAT
ncbi:MAG: hypothetical protein HKN70_05840 [Gammaproteobacteria bacterium]|nr:hypothetical protein [Gammaproteobacteria bacterium]